jgi:hypothetical protein
MEVAFQCIVHRLKSRYERKRARVAPVVLPAARSLSPPTPLTFASLSLVLLGKGQDRVAEDASPASTSGRAS